MMTITYCARRIAPSLARLGLFGSTLLLLLTSPGTTAEAAKFEAYKVELPANLVSFEMLPVPGGSFEFADPAKGGTAGQVAVKPFWMGKVEVTWDEFDVFCFRMDQTDAEVAANADAANRPSMPYGAPDRGYGHQGYPAISIAAQAAQKYCEWLSKKTGVSYRLATEAEWEWAARGGAAEAKANADNAWTAANSPGTTQPVAQKQANGYGLHDLLGNVVEWVVASDGELVTRGGSFKDAAEFVTHRKRAVKTDDWQAQDPQQPKSKWWLSDGDFVGFRIVRAYEPGQ
ncbi:MAG: SUMF1/EgtB/PvdO family nonheme iron enzyme [Fimbriimonadaceae bacterium]|nr:SUMF1/EgtB/PvdO family nonheme iron enzyme [Fimbriimonadaceae bacterium]